MTSTLPPHPVTSKATVVTFTRSAFDECDEAFRVAGSKVRKLAEKSIHLPDGTIAVIRCSRSEAGDLRVTISHWRPAPLAVAK